MFKYMMALAIMALTINSAQAAPQVKNVGNFNNYVLTSGFIMTAGLQYSVYVTVVDASGESLPSNTQTFIYNPPTTTGILNWTAPTTNADGTPLVLPILYYNVYLFFPGPPAASFLSPVR